MDATGAVLLVTDHSHLFRGARLVADQWPQEVPMGDADVCIEFGDGTSVAAGLALDAELDHLVLVVSAYKTARSTAIGERAWLVRLVERDESEPGLLLIVKGRRA